MGPVTIVWAATDATNRSTAFVLIPHDPRGEIFVAAAEHSPADVAVLELCAIAEAAREARRRFQGPIELRVATDSAICDAVVEKRYSRSEALDPLLDELDILAEQGVRVITKWLPSAANVADIPSRRVIDHMCVRCERLRHGGYVGDARCKCERPMWEPLPANYGMREGETEFESRMNSTRQYLGLDLKGKQ
jgi:hypothetical protein